MIMIVHQCNLNSRHARIITQQNLLRVNLKAVNDFAMSKSCSVCGFSSKNRSHILFAVQNNRVKNYVHAQKESLII